MFRFLVLGLLRPGGSFHGYAVMKEYRQRSGVQVSTGNFYRELQRLVAEGFVRTVNNPADADPRRAPYEITEEGAAAFDDWLTGPVGAAVGRYDDELSSRTLFLGSADPTVTRELIEDWKEQLWLRSKTYERARGALITARSGDVRRSFDALPVLFARNLKHLAADLEFLEELQEAYDAWVSVARGPSARVSRAVASPPRRRMFRGKEPDERH